MLWTGGYMQRVQGASPVEAVPNISKFTVGGGPAGMIVAGAFLVIGLIGLPQARWFLAGSVTLGGLFALILRRR